MSLEIEPSDILTFQRPLTKITEEILRVRNLKAEPAIFKVKTTAPKQYCVRPNAGRIEPFSEIEVHVILQPFKTEPPADYKCKDKFLVQSAAIQPTEDESIPVTELWGRIEHSGETTIYQHKIKCTFTNPPDIEQKEIIPEPQSQEIETKEIPIVNKTVREISKEQPTVPADIPKPIEDPVTIIPEAEPAPKVDIPEIPTAVETPNKNSSSPSVSASAVSVAPVLNEIIKDKSETPQLKKEIIKDDIVAEQQPQIREIKKETVTPQVKEEIIKDEPIITPQVVNNSSSSSSTRSMNHEELKKKEQVDDQEKIKLKQELVSSKENVSRLENELQQLKKELEELRLRQKSSSDSVSNTTTNKKLSSTVQPLDAVHQRLAQLQKPHPTEGYPPQVVAVIGLVIFLFTYLFF